METPFTSPEEKQELLAKFKALETLGTKLQFWREELKSDYVQFLSFMALDVTKATKELLDYWYGYDAFKIIPKKEEYEAYNKLIIDESRLMYERFSKKQKYPSLAELIANFETRASGIAANKKDFIEKEIEAVKNLVGEKSKEVPRLDIPSGRFFKSAFDQYYYNRQPVDLSKDFHFDLENVLALYQGQVYGEYLEYLEIELEKAGKASKKLQEFSLNQQLLVLDYWGIMERIEKLDDTVQATQLSIFLNKNYQNIRVALSDREKLKSSSISAEQKQIRKDLEAVYEFFQSLGFKREAKEVKADLQKLGG